MDRHKQYRQQERLSLLLFLSEVPNFVIVVALAISTRSLVVLMDLIDSTGNLLRALFMFLLAKKLRKDLRYQYNYGVGKVEATASMCLDFVLILSLISMIVFSVRDIIVPRQPEEALGFAVIFKVCCVAGDAYMFIRQKMICRSSDSLVFRAELSMRVKNLAFDSATLVAILLIYLLRDFEPAWYFSPVFCLVLVVWLGIGIMKRMHQALGEVLDKTAGEDVQNTVLEALTAHHTGYDAFNAVHSRVSGGTVFIDLRLGFPDGMTYREIRELVDGVYADVKEKIPNCEISVQITNTPVLPPDANASDTAASAAASVANASAAAPASDPAPAADACAPAGD